MLRDARPSDTGSSEGPTRWHYRRSLASRLSLLTTLAVGLAVAFVAFGAFWTAKMQMQATLDESLIDRAQKAAISGIPLDAVYGPGNYRFTDYFIVGIWLRSYPGC